MSETANLDRFLAVVGPTASGKSSLALFLAEQLNAEIVSCDSVQIYKGLNIGSAKPSSEEQKVIPHHLIDILNVTEDYDAGAYAHNARAVIRDINRRSRLAIVVGGTGLYLRSLVGKSWHDLPSDPEIKKSFVNESTEDLMKRLQELDPERAKQIHPNDRFRIERALEINLSTGRPVSSQTENDSQQVIHKTLFLNPPMATLDEKIKLRTSKMLQSGLIEETEFILSHLKKTVQDPLPKALHSIGYAEVIQMLQGKIQRNELEAKLCIATHQYAKRQKTWFRKIGAELTVCVENKPKSILDHVKILVEQI